MSKSRFSTRQMTLAALIAAIYAVLTLFLPIPQYGEVQFRVAEAMTLLPFLFPAAIPGLTLGCFIANLFGSPMVLDWLVGTFATLLAALWTSKLKHRWMAPIPPILCNALLVGAELTFLTGAPSLPTFGAIALSVGLGEAAVCIVLGLPLLMLFQRNSVLKPLSRQLV